MRLTSSLFALSKKRKNFCLADPLQSISGCERQFMNSGEWNEKLKAFLIGLQVENLADLLERGKVGDYRRLGEIMSERIIKLAAKTKEAQPETAGLPSQPGHLQHGQQKICPICNGRGVKIVKHDKIENEWFCTHCNGTGKLLA